MGNVTETEASALIVCDGGRVDGSSTSRTRNLRRRQAITVSGWTMTSAVRHPVQMRDSQTQSQRSAVASGNRRGRRGVSVPGVR
jgi:hypothetical protein